MDILKKNKLFMNISSVKKKLNLTKAVFIRFLFSLILCIFATIFYSCVANYSFTGASINAETKTFHVENFINRASIVQPILSSELTYALINKIRSGTSLIETEDEADASFVGTITAYRVTPTAITATDQAAKNRLTIVIRVKYTNRTDSKSNFDETFTRYKDYDASLSLASVEEALIKEINDELVDDIFNKAFVNW
ncbi:MAG: LptE family protein [Bacteroidales bacterium]|nr:LptE family protein [Bacteroidales bacterium]